MSFLAKVVQYDLVSLRTKLELLVSKLNNYFEIMLKSLFQAESPFIPLITNIVKNALHGFF